MPLSGKIAVVTGSSKGIGKGIALALAEKGCTVYTTGRTTGDGDRSIDTTARQVNEAGGVGRAIRCDRVNADARSPAGSFVDHDVEAVFE